MKTNKTIHIVTQTFDGPIDSEVLTHTGAIEIGEGSAPAITQSELQAGLVMLFARAAHAGFDVTIDKISSPQRGMGGHDPRITITPDFATSRAKMAEVSAAKQFFQVNGYYPPNTKVAPAKWPFSKIDDRGAEAFPPSGDE